MKKIKIFITFPAAELQTDRIEIEAFLRRLNDCYIEKGIYFTLMMREDAGGPDGEQSEHARMMFDSDLAFFLFLTESDRETWEALDAAEANFRRDNRPRIIPYFKTAAGRPQTGEIERFKKRLSQTAEYYCNTYEHIDTLKLGILMQIKQLELDGVDIRLENGRAWQGSVALLSLDHVEMVSGYEELQRQKTARAGLESRFYAAKTQYAENPEDEAAYEAFYEAARLRNEAVRELRDMETRLYHTMEGMYEQTVRGKLSKRQVEGYRLTERGRFREAQSVLDFDGIVSESRYDETLADKVDQRAQVHVNEQLQLVDVNKTLGDWDGVDACYREAMRLEERHGLNKRAMYGYAQFLHRQNRYADGIAVAEKLRYYYQKPEDKNPDDNKWRLYNLLGRMYMDTKRMAEAETVIRAAITSVRTRDEDTASAALADSYNMLGTICAFTQRLGEAETMYKAALEIRETLAGKNPDADRLPLSNLYNNLGNIFRETQRLAESEEMTLSALEIRKKLYAKSPDEFGPIMATTYNNLGVLYNTTMRYAEAEAVYTAALEIQTKLAGQNPEGYEPWLARIYNNLGLCYRLAKRSEEAEPVLRRGLSILERLAARNPDAFDEPLSESFHNLGLVYTLAKRYPEAEAMFTRALSIRRRLTAENPDAGEPALTYTYEELGVLYLEWGRFAEAEAMITAALELLIKLAARNPDAFEMSLADGYWEQARLYRAAGRATKAEESYRTALRLYEKYADVHPQCAEQAGETRKALSSLREAQTADGLSGRDPLFTPEEKAVALLLTDGDTARDISRKLSLPAAEVGRLVRAVRAKIVSAGEPDSNMAAVVVAFKLTKREAHILRCLCRDMSNAEIAAEMVVAEETVRFHTHRLFKKLPPESRRSVAEWVGSFSETTV